MTNQKTNLPEKFLAQIQADLPTEFDAFYQAMAADSPVSIRLNSRKKASIEFDKIVQSPVPYTELGFYLSARPSFTYDPLFHAGCYYVQEASSMFISHIINQLYTKNDNVIALDLCAAPGGKSTLLLDNLSPNSFLVANEVIKNRAFILRENCTKWGFDNVAITNNDPKDFAKLPDFFDLILVDAPCSGEGMFRKDATSISEWSEENVKICTLRQQQIIADILPSLKPNGVLIYSTCTYNQNENTKNINLFIEKYDLELVEINTPIDWNINQSQKGCFQFYPHKNKGEGFFCAVLRKKSSDEINKKYIKTKNLNFVSKLETQVLVNWIENATETDFIHINENIHAINKLHIAHFQAIFANLYCIGAGILMGKILKNQLIPEHDLALSVLITNKIEKAELNFLEAIDYLKKNDISNFDCIQEIENGWFLVTYKNKNLGWAKKIGNRTNNYYPKEWRIMK